MLRIKTALFSLFDRTGALELAQALVHNGVVLYASSGTAAYLAEHEIPVHDISTITGFANLLGGRVKTLHPDILAPILARKQNIGDITDLKTRDLKPMDLVVCSLYPFSAVAANRFSTAGQLVEQIDIGGITLIRAAAKNFSNCAILTRPDQYQNFLAEWQDRGGISRDLLLRLSQEAFFTVAAYDAAIVREMSTWQVRDSECERKAGKFPPCEVVLLRKTQDLAYGENPHQQAAAYQTEHSGLQAEYTITPLHGKAMSYNNMRDLSAVLDVLAEFDACTCVIVKHTNPCGVGHGASGLAAFQRAFATDTKSPFGGIVGLNVPVDAHLARELHPMFLEIIVAPAFTAEALAVLRKKKKRRLLIMQKRDVVKGQLRDMITHAQGVLLQDRNWVTKRLRFDVVSKRQPTQQEKQALSTAWKVVKHVHSNGIVLADADGTVAIGAGQMSRVDGLELALMKRELPQGFAVMASDGFFPFRDSVDLAHAHGIRAIIEPGGSIRDKDVIAAADAHDMALVFTHVRHFKHY